MIGSIFPVFAAIAGSIRRLMQEELLPFPNCYAAQAMSADIDTEPLTKDILRAVGIDGLIESLQIDDFFHDDDICSAETPTTHVHLGVAQDRLLGTKGRSEKEDLCRISGIRSKGQGLSRRHEKQGNGASIS